MAPAGGRTTHLLLALFLSFVLASSVAASYEEHRGQGAGGFFSGIPWFRGGGGQPGGVRGAGGIGAGFSGGWGAGGVGPGGGFARRGVVQPSMVCAEQGPCYQQRLTCPSKCFSSYSYHGKNGGGGGGGGGCSFDCTSRCEAHC
ncbi:glycine-rich cell wall structural protein-like [Hordeum vulgare]|uniref:Uncharacterized protein n=1 Tax=Hordeum vulgare subsp. vulgare TaxID=112509 RepID=A0A8I6XD94_HORVV|nr:ctenidin-3-like [Hordeum vulgare subsp. vulgare]KAE8812256.1 glycine-rich cell wall structural protein-like [Hordeum vulgare]KAI5012585.1 hypothetical protein ZWY2020_024851 [Hordeum vulgare]